MNGTDIVRLPKFLEGEKLPSGYYDTPNPYTNPSPSGYHLRAMVNYAVSQGKKVPDLTKEEAEAFIIKK